MENKNDINKLLDELDDQVTPLKINYMQVIPHSQFYTDIQRIIKTLKSTNYDKEYILTALENTLKNGYNIYKTNEVLESNVKILKDLNDTIENSLKQIKI